MVIFHNLTCISIRIKYQKNRMLVQKYTCLSWERERYWVSSLVGAVNLSKPLANRGEPLVQPISHLSPQTFPNNLRPRRPSQMCYIYPRAAGSVLEITCKAYLQKSFLRNIVRSFGGISFLSSIGYLLLDIIM